MTHLSKMLLPVQSDSVLLNCIERSSHMKLKSQYQHKRAVFHEIKSFVYVNLAYKHENTISYRYQTKEARYKYFDCCSRQDLDITYTYLRDQTNTNYIIR